MKKPSLLLTFRSAVARLSLALQIFAGLMIALGACLAVRGADEVPDELVKLRAAFDKDIDFATRPIRDRYLSRLETLKRSLGSRGDARGAAAVQDEVDRIHVTSGGPAAFAKFAGTWKVVYSTGQTKRYIITPDGVVKGTDFDEKTGLPVGAASVTKLVTKGSDVILDFNGGTLERLKMAEKNLSIEHFSPRTLYPASAANYHATGTLVSVQRE